MGLLVLAKGGETPLVPDPLSLQDMGRDPVLTLRLVNMYTEPTPQGPSSSARYQRPGLYEVAQRGGGPIRATFLWQGFRITVSGTSVWRDNVNIGQVPADGHLRWAITDEECVLVAGRRAYFITLNDVTRITDTDLPFVIDVFVLAGRFIYIDDAADGRFHYSAVGDARTIDGLGFASAESSPDPLVGGAVVGDRMGLFGTKTVEWWYPTTDADAPFQRSQGQSYSKGLAAIRSLVQADNSLFMVGNDRMVYRSGSVPLRVSNHDVEDRLRRVTDADLPNITAYTVNFGGHTFYVMNLPGQGTHALDIGQRLWAEWKSWGKDRFRIDFAEDNYMGDFYSGRIMGFDGAQFTDFDEPIERICSAFAPIRGGTERNFNLALACTRGVGRISGYGSQPVVEMRFSDHEGANWSDWMEQPLGAIGDRSEAAKAVWTQLGALKPPGRLYEFRCTDPVFFAPYELKINEARP